MSITKLKLLRNEESSMMKETPSAVSIKDGASKISEEDMPLVTDIMRWYDIPMFSFNGTVQYRKIYFYICNFRIRVITECI